ncbi:DNA recombination protein RmuC [Salinibacter ruber]|uniref:DNA recombination protein RmuC n=1 Tax=Salinibacter ruber TaxID=146919 RepID=UPI0021693882|nr:DNA recombination protein RmuC [Salinibacter ruber]MCS3940422.1 DNA recombination protein RmuC [Salinibacter ruber]
MPNILILSFALALGSALLGGGIAWLALKRRVEAAYERGLADREEDVSALKQKVSALQQETESLTSQLGDVKAERDELSGQVGDLREETSTLETKNENLRSRLEEQEGRIEKQQEELRDQFKNLANEILEEKTEKFTEQNEENLDQLLGPLQEKLEGFKEKVEETYEKGLKERSQLETQIEQLSDLNETMSERAEDLVGALEGQSKTQGDWGEMVLKRILEESGLKEGREYHTQVSRTNGQGKRLRPDCVIELPEDRFVVVDSKVSLTAYRRFSSADGEEERQSHLKDHLQSVRSHVEGLASKDYGSLYGERSPDFALMFMPIEPAFALALQNDEGLYQSAFDQGVVIVSPTTLQATTLTIANIWRQERQTQNAREIAERGGRLYDKFVLFAEALEEVGQRIDQAQESYHTARKRLTDGRGNLLRQVEMLRELGAENSKDLPEEMEGDLARADLPDSQKTGSDDAS